MLESNINSKKKWLKRLGFFSLILFVLIAFLFIRTINFPSKQLSFEKAPHVTVNPIADSNLIKSIQCKTISYPGKIDTLAFVELRHILLEAYPLMHKKLKLTVVNKFGLLYEWKGTNPQLKPFLLMSHQDVVPISPNTEELWFHPPFSGAKSKGYIFGRGTLDVKSGIIAQMEAVEALLKRGVQPKRTLYLAYGHDEEVGGTNGAMKIATLLKKKNVKLDFVLDEGGSIISGVVPGVKKPVALIGVAEKGYASFKLSVFSKGGHSSMPPKQTSIGILSAAVEKLEAKPFPAKLAGIGSLMFDYVGPEMDFGMRLIFANKWLFGLLIENKLDQSDATRATIHTSLATTIFNSGDKDNVLPVKAEAIVNVRILPGESIESTRLFIRKTIDDPRVKISLAGGKAYEPSVVSHPESKQFKKIQRTVSEIFPEVIVAPYLMLGASDSKHYRQLTQHIFRFIPLRLNKNDLNRIHGTNERIAIDNFHECIRFYTQLIKNEQLR
jgi:carboxypeptidase PM20D1